MEGRCACDADERASYMTWTNDYTEDNQPADAAMRQSMGDHNAAQTPPTDDEARARILATPVDTDATYTYGTAADACARLMIETLESSAKARAKIAQASDDWDKVSLLYDATNAHTDGALRPLGLTGFQVGWAANMAFKLARPGPLPPVKNPAIIELG